MRDITMKFSKTLTIPGLLLALSAGAFASDFDLEKEKQRFFIGTDWYYTTSLYFPTGPANHSALYRSKWNRQTKLSLIDKAIEGEFFEPRAFWAQPMDDQLRYLKEEIISCNLSEIVSRHYETLWCSHTTSPYGIPYKPEEEMAFREAIWPKIQKFIADNHLEPLSKEKFFYSLTINVKPEASRGSIAPADAPLIRHFSRYLCPLWKLGTYEQFPSWFEQFILEPKED